MTILACVPAPDFVVLGGERVFLADDIPLAIAIDANARFVHPRAGAPADLAEICGVALQKFPRDRPSTVGEFARGFARGCAAMLGDGPTVRAFVAGVAPEEKLAAAFELLLVAGQAPRVTRVFDPFVGDAENAIAGLPSHTALRETFDSATTLLKNPPPRKVARLVRKLISEAGGGEADAVVITRDGTTRVSS